MNVTARHNANGTVRRTTAHYDNTNSAEIHQASRHLEPTLPPEPDAAGGHDGWHHRSRRLCQQRGTGGAAQRRTIASRREAPVQARSAAVGIGWRQADAGYGRRLNGLAGHVYDGAVADYLLDNASDIGREVTSKSAAYAPRPLVDDAAYERCVTAPER